MNNPFSRKPKTRIEQAFAVANGVRSEAATAAASVRDAATKTVEALGEATPIRSPRRLPVVGAAAAVGAGAAVALRKRAGGGAGTEPITSPATAEVPQAPPSVGTAAATTAAPPAGEAEPAVEAKPEQPKEPRAETPESDPEDHASPGLDAADEPEQPKEPKAETPESESTK